MNYGMILRILSRVSLTEAVLLAISALVALLYGDAVLLPYGLPIALLLAAGLGLGAVRPKRRDFFAREGFIAVSLSWIYMSVFGALPFYLSGAIPSFVDSLFETVSGFTTTGATLLTRVEALPRGLLFWRSFTHFIGGMGVLVFLMAVIPLAGGRSMHLMRAESPGPVVGKLVPKARSSSAILYGIYIGLTLLQTIMLLLGGMPLFDSVTTAFSTAGTGGFSVRDGGIMAYQSPYIEIVVTVFALIFSTNFAVYFLLIAGRPKDALRSEEPRWYLGIFAVATIAITINILPRTGGLGEALRLAAFQNASVMSTSGFASADYNAWPELSHAILILLTIIGSCAGSTGGGFKVSRVVILIKSIRREISRLVHPRAVAHIKFEHKTVDEETTHSVLVYLAVYVVLAMAGILLIATDALDHITTFTAVLATLNNVGPGLALVGPMGNFSIFSPFAKVVLTALMLIGRLEIFPILLLCTPSVWRQK